MCIYMFLQIYKNAGRIISIQFSFSLVLVKQTFFFFNVLIRNVQYLTSSKVNINITFKCFAFLT